jgi:GntR family transcriptional regulator
MWNLDPKKGPIYLQLAEQIVGELLSGRWSPGERLPPSRAMAVEAALNPNTIVATYDELERRGIIIKRRGIGVFFKDDLDVDAIRMKELASVCQEFVEKIEALGSNRQTIINILSDMRGL